jgi:hypothetical protein
MMMLMRRSCEIGPEIQENRRRSMELFVSTYAAWIKAIIQSNPRVASEIFQMFRPNARVMQSKVKFGDKTNEMDFDPVLADPIFNRVMSTYPTYT